MDLLENQFSSNLQNFSHFFPNIFHHTSFSISYFYPSLWLHWWCFFFFSCLFPMFHFRKFLVLCLQEYWSCVCSVWPTMNPPSAGLSSRGDLGLFLHHSFSPHLVHSFSVSLNTWAIFITDIFNILLSWFYHLDSVDPPGSVSNWFFSTSGLHFTTCLHDEYFLPGY